MSSKLFVGGLAWATTDASLHAAFSQFGEVIDAKVITDRETGRSRGFGFVTFAEGPQAQEAIQKMDGQELDGRSIRVNEAQERSRAPRGPRSDGPRREYARGGGGGGGGGGFGGGGGGGFGGGGGGGFGGGGGGGPRFGGGNPGGFPPPLDDGGGRGGRKRHNGGGQRRRGGGGGDDWSSNGGGGGGGGGSRRGGRGGDYGDDW